MKSYDYKSFKSYNLIKRLHTIDSNGILYVLCFIEEKIRDDRISKELCQLYLNLNDKLHPKIKPKTVIMENIDKMIEICEKDCIPEHYKDIISRQLLVELRKDVDLIKF